MNDSTLFSTTASMDPRRAIMCPGCGRLHHGPGAYCGTACSERVREEVHRVVTAEVPLVVHTPAAIVLGHLLVDLQAMVTKRLVGELSGMLTLARAPAGGRLPLLAAPRAEGAAGLRVPTVRRPGVRCEHCGLPHPSNRCNRPEGVAARGGRVLRVGDLPNSMAGSEESARRGRDNAARKRRNGGKA